MRRIEKFLATMAIAGLAVSIPGVASASAAAAAGNGGSGGSSNLCRVQVRRNASAGVFDVSRAVLDNGRCVCRVSTGPRSQGGSAESALASLLLRRSCADAPLAAATGATGGISTGLLIGGLAAAGLGIGLALGGSSSP